MTHVEGSDFTSHFEYKVVLQRRYQDGTWEDATSADLLAATSTAGYKLGNTFSNRQEIGLQARTVVKARVKSGGNGTHRGNLSITLAVRLFCC